MTKVFVIGLDCAPPEIVFDPAMPLPNLRALMDQGISGPMASCTPCITVPAWSVMTSGRDPGQLGIYGFRNRADRGYFSARIANGADIRVDRVWDTLGRAGRKCIVVGVPQTYPVRPVNGHLVSCFLTPNANAPYTWPPALKPEIQRLIGDYRMDVADFRTEDKAALLRQIYDVTEQHLKIVRHLMTTKPWDFFMYVEIATDRIHHGFWRFHDPLHPKHDPVSPFVTAIRDYYIWLDARLGEIIALVPSDCAVMVVSDHGAKRMDGGIAINHWLIQNGWLTLKAGSQTPAGRVPLSSLDVDWPRTRAWGEGGYYGRVFLNVMGREPQGVIEPEAFESTRADLAAQIAAIPDHLGRPLPTRCFRPEGIYREVNGIPPDLLVYFGDLLWRSIGTVDAQHLDVIHTFDNDTGPDDCNHAEQGIFVLREPGARAIAAPPANLIEIHDVLIRLSDAG